MIEQGDLPAAAQLMDHFNLHHLLPPLDPAEVEACARAHAARHLQIPLADSRVFLVDGWESLLYAERSLAMPPKVIGRDPGGDRAVAGAYCVGLDVESSPHDSTATVLQVRRGIYLSRECNGAGMSDKMGEGLVAHVFLPRAQAGFRLVHLSIVRVIGGTSKTMRGLHVVTLETHRC